MSLRALLSYNETAMNSVKHKSQREIDEMREAPVRPLITYASSTVHSSLPVKSGAEIGALAAFKPNGMEEGSVLDNWRCEEQAAREARSAAGPQQHLNGQGLNTARSAHAAGKPPTLPRVQHCEDVP